MQRCGVISDGSHECQNREKISLNTRDKNSSSSSKDVSKKEKEAMLFNGFALVGEDEGEGLSLLSEGNQNSRIIPEKSNNQSLSVSAAARLSSWKEPMGRGRKNTLPAWMTRSDNNANNNNGGDGSVGVKNSETNYGTSRLHCCGQRK